MCIAHVAIHLPPAPLTRAISAWKSAPIATRSLPASRRSWTLPAVSSASAASTPRTSPQPPRRSDRVCAASEPRAVILSAAKDLFGGESKDLFEYTKASAAAEAFLLDPGVQSPAVALIVCGSPHH